MYYAWKVSKFTYQGKHFNSLFARLYYYMKNFFNLLAKSSGISA